MKPKPQSVIVYRVWGFDMLHGVSGCCFLKSGAASFPDSQQKRRQEVLAAEARNHVSRMTAFILHMEISVFRLKLYNEQVRVNEVSREVRRYLSRALSLAIGAK